MKNPKSVLFAFISLFFTITLSAKTVQHEVVFDANLVVDTLIAKDGGTYSVLKLPNSSFVQEEGAPQLPVKIITLIIPDGEEAVDVSCSVGNSSIITLDYPVLPVQAPIPTSTSSISNKFVKPNKNIYSGENYPKQST